MARFFKRLPLTTRYSLCITAAAALIYLYEKCCITGIAVTGSSMAPALSASFSSTGATDFISYQRFNPLLDIRKKPPSVKSGDVIIFHKPHQPGGLTIKRVIGTEGDRILRDERRVALSNRHGRRFRFGVLPTEIVVPPGHVFVEGDNWQQQSFDSNDFGCLPLSMVIGIVTSRAKTRLSLLYQSESITKRPTGKLSDSHTRVVEASNHPTWPNQSEDVLEDWYDAIETIQDVENSREQ